MELLNQSDDDFGITDVDDDSSDGEDDEDNDEDDEDNDEDDNYEEVAKFYFNCFVYQKLYVMYPPHYLCVSL